jgi:hypothetical protein
MNKRDRKSLIIQKELNKLLHAHLDEDSGMPSVFHVYHQMVWFGLNGMRSVWSEIKGMGLPSSANWIDWTKPKIIEMLDKVEGVGHDKLRERRAKGENMPSWLDRKGGEHYTPDEDLN